MTGYGRAVEKVGGGLTVEIRAVNGRFLKTTIKLPSGWGELEERVKALVVAEGVRRGTVEVWVHRGEAEANGCYEIAPEVVERYLKQLRRLRKKLQTAESAAAKFSPEALLALPGVVRRVESKFDAAAVWRRMEPLLRSALKRFVAMRKQEGAATAADVRAHLKELAKRRLELVSLAENTAAARLERLRARLVELLETPGAGGRDGANKLKNSLSRGALEREAALMADRADVGEELARLDSHFRQMNDILAHGGAEVGKTLDFLTQELLREVNTVGSKAQDVRLTRQVVAMKGLIEKVREQVQNIE